MTARTGPSTGTGTGTDTGTDIRTQMDPGTVLDRTRRSVLAGSAVLAAGTVAALAGCSSSGAAVTAATAAPSSEETATAIGNVTPTSAAPTEAALGDVADIKVGSGVIYSKEKLVVTQPTQGEYKAFSAVCTHQGCIVAAVSEGQITCPCHGSAFSVKDGSVLQGPATTALAEAKITLTGGKITQA